MKKYTNGLFIVGSPRSGTTLLQSMLASHSELYSSPETSFFDRIIPRLGVEYYNPSHLVRPTDHELIKKDMQNMTGATLDCILKFRDGMNIKDVFEQLMCSFNKNEKKYWVEKTTNHARFMLAIQRFYPRVKFVNIIRDPVDSVASMWYIKPVNVSDDRISYLPAMSGLASLWRECVEAAFMYPYQENVLHIRYEDLVLEPERSLYKICNFLHIRFEPNMLNAFGQTAQNLFNAEHCPWQKINTVPGLRKNAVHKWRHRLSQEQIWLIQKYTAPWSSRLGYLQYVSCPFHKKVGVLGADIIKKGVGITGIERKIRQLISRF